jgi:hypothetical protein
MAAQEECSGAPSCSTNIVGHVVISTFSCSCSNYSDKIVNKRLLIVEAVARKGLGGNLQLFLSKHLLHTAVCIMFLEMNVDYQLTCAGYEYSKSHSL